MNDLNDLIPTAIVTLDVAQRSNLSQHAKREIGIDVLCELLSLAGYPEIVDFFREL
jgi:hypothetical protein